MSELTFYSFFPSNVYTIDAPEFLEDVTSVFEEFIKKRKESEILSNELYPAIMTEYMFNDERIKPLCAFIGETAWDILSKQGYNMNLFGTTFTEIFGQEHPKNSAMEQHFHGHGDQIVGFYFLNSPENSSKVLIHDPRPAKVIINLPETDNSKATPASTIINFEPKAGQLFFTNAWLAHSFTRHGNDEPLKFIHFNIGVKSKEDVIQQSIVELPFNQILKAEVI